MNRYPSKFHISTHSCLIRVYMSQSSCIYTGHLVISPCHSMLVCFSLIKDGKSTCTFSFGSSFLHLGCQSPSQHLTEDHVYLSTWNSYWVNGAEVHFSLVTRLCLTLCSPMDCSTPGFPVHHQLLELAQTHVHQAGDAIQPSHPLLTPSFAQHQGLFHLQLFTSGGQSVGASASASVLPVNIQGLFPLGLTGLFSLQSKELSRAFSSTIQKHQFFST